MKVHVQLFRSCAVSSPILVHTHLSLFPVHIPIHIHLYPAPLTGALSIFTQFLFRHPSAPTSCTIFTSFHFPVHSSHLFPHPSFAVTLSFQGHLSPPPPPTFLGPYPPLFFWVRIWLPFVVKRSINLQKVKKEKNSPIFFSDFRYERPNGGRRGGGGAKC